jgi:hypothetical protein
MPKPLSKPPDNFVAEVNGHQIYSDGNLYHIWTQGVGWWGFDMTEDEARRTCQAVSDPKRGK